MNNAKSLRNILIVDDEEKVLFMVHNSLAKIDGIGQIELAQDGEEALEKIKHHQFDLMITDLSLPGLDGISLTEALGEISPETCVIWMTAIVNAELQEKAIVLNVQHFLAKPLEVTDIRKIAQEALAETIQNQRNHAPQLSSSFDVLKNKIHQLKGEIGAYAVMIITKTGHLIDADGLTKEMDVTSLSALIAANFIAANEIATMLGRDNKFKVSFYESDQYNIHAYGLGDDYLLVTMFGSSVKTGAVCFYTKKMAAELEALLGEMETQHDASSKLVQGFTDEVEQGVGKILQDIWLSSAPLDTQPAPQKKEENRNSQKDSERSSGVSQQILTYTYQEAIDHHILSADLFA